MSEIETSRPGDNEINDLVEEFAGMHVSQAALEESLGVKVADMTETDAANLRRIIAFMRHDKLTLSRAIMAVTKGTKIIKKSVSARSVDFGQPRKKAPAAKESKTVRKTKSDTMLEEAPPEAKKSVTRRVTPKDNLLIVESPAKAKTIKKFLGGDFVVKASMGHVRDIPTRGRDRSDIGIDFQNHYQPYYVPIESREKVIKELRGAAEKAKHVYLAPDPDREGEAIAWHLKEVLDLPDDRVSRVTFNAITKSAVREAMQHPSSVNMDLVNAQQGRRVLDRIVGYRLSPFLWKKVTKGLSAGRVQSVAVRMVAEREQEIQDFTPVEYWRIRADLAPRGQDETFMAELVGWKGEPFVLASGDKKASATPTAPDEATAAAIVAALHGAPYRVAEVVERDVKGRPSPPFITSSLQQAASNVLRIGAQRTMRIAQQLYEGIELEGGEATGLITYMRTDSTRIAPEALTEVRDYIGKNFAPPYLPEKPNFYSSRKGAQDAHEAIRPTSAFLTPERVKAFLTPEQYRLYELIWRRFVASQLSPAEYRITTAKIAAGDGVFEAKGRRILFDGHTVLSPAAARKKKKEEAAAEAEPVDSASGQTQDEDQILPELAANQPLDLKELAPSRHFTQPPVRFTEASLVRELEKEGIGRPSTYAPIVQTIQERGYVRQENRRFHATRLGMAVTGILKDNFPDIMDVKFTAQMEADLDRVEEGEVNWDRLVDGFYKPFDKRLKEAMETSAALKGAPAPNGEKCPQCGGDMMIRYSQRGAFLGCSRYPDCAGTRQLPGEDGEFEGEDGEQEVENCPECGQPMVRKRSRFGVFLACSAYPNCKCTRPIAKNGKAVKLPETKRDCEKCGKPMVVKSGRRGPFLACSGYPECRNTKHLDKNGEVVELPSVDGAICDKCGAEMVVRMSRRGPFLACSAYPKCRNAKPIPKDE